MGTLHTIKKIISRRRSLYPSGTVVYFQDADNPLALEVDQWEYGQALMVQIYNQMAVTL